MKEQIIKGIKAVLGAAGLVYGLYFGYGHWNTGFTVMEVVKSLASILVGAGYMIPNSLSIVNSLVSQTPKIKSQPVIKKDTQMAKEEENVGATEDEMKDFQCLMYLRNRVKELNSDAGADACNKLHQVLFAIPEKSKAAVKE